ncbi:monovalent cation/H+ antiporter complex subunit F [Azotobacter chroococcum]|uniref:Na+/H+ antiporter component F n=2 Tax=Azotobacter chroococcum TaxID=353 RepID=A0A0C4WND1_9GAMM|nr:monovalent cation/H+ antiporter complex subunit F [Azotobacter chroococcum]AJE21010.1 Na+/H+ antiporter component F [Azotobacter chroococcum NCIMB 8003]QQE87425.1 pH regulation protein F [Azotobacter chroococcum]TBW11114.1 pH regulation protein F [Azotobacter chroococcum]TKD39359.1 pH regulation protein F [Azotobacter chroococcum]
MIVELAGAAWVLPVAALLLVASALLILYRLLRGPGHPDRVVALDALTLVAVASMALAALFRVQAVLLDVAVLLALMSFIGTTAFVFLFRKESAEHEARNEKEKEP